MNDPQLPIGPEQMRKNASFVFWALLFGLGVFGGLCFVAKLLPPIAFPVFYVMDGFALTQVLKGLGQVMPKSTAIAEAEANRWTYILAWPFMFPALFRKLDQEPK